MEQMQNEKYEKKKKQIPPSIYALASNFVEYIEEVDREKKEKQEKNK